MNEADLHPPCHQRRLPRDHLLKQCGVGVGRIRDLWIVAGDHMVGELPDGIAIVARREELERADPDMARCDPGQHGAGQRGFALDSLAGQHSGKSPCGGNAEGGHRLADDVFAQDWSECGASIATAGKGCWSCAFELQIASLAMAVDDLAQQDRPSVAELGYEMPELVPGIGHRDRSGRIGHRLAGKDGKASGEDNQSASRPSSWAKGRLSLISRGAKTGVGATRA